MKRYFYSLMRKYISLFALPQNSIVEIDPETHLLIGSMPNGKIAFRSPRDDQGRFGNVAISIATVKEQPPDYIILTGRVHHERDVQELLDSVRLLCHPETRLIITYYSALWRPLASLATLLRMRRKYPRPNWLAHEDIQNFLRLSDFELVRSDSKVLVPIYVPILSNVINRYVAPLPFFRSLCLVNIAVAKPLTPASNWEPSVSIVVPARNEAGNIEKIIDRIPAMGPHDEIILIEGNSSDNTWDAVQAAQKRYLGTRTILIGQQDGKGKGDAVRKGFAMASQEILMILDADMTVPPEDLPKFYNAIRLGRGEFINGSRLVYPMEKEAMRFFNLLGNKFFALAFSFVLGQRYKDTLCGTKALTRENYLKLAANRSYFGDFDPFGDFDLIFGAARMGLKITEVPIAYRERTYGETNISRWRHGAILIAMLAFAARRIKFL